MSKADRAARLLDATRLGGLLRRLKSWRGALVLAYHRVESNPDPLDDEGLLSASAEAFDDQIRLLERHFDVADPSVLLDHAQKPSRHLVITFDDGYRDAYDVALPVLASHGVTATFFLATGFIDSPRWGWWDEIAWMVRKSPRASLPAAGRLSAPVNFDDPLRREAIRTLLGVYKQLPGDRTEAFLDFLAEASESGRRPRQDSTGMWLTWDMVREMRRAGMTFGGHTVNHPVLSRLDRERQHDEIRECRRRIEQEVGGPMSYFSYPVGLPDSFDGDTRACLREEGVKLAFSDYGGYPRPGHTDHYDVPRSNVAHDSAPGTFGAMLALPQLFARW